MMNRGVMQRQMFVAGGVANAEEAKQRSLIINQIINIADRTNRPLDPTTVTYLQNLSTSDLITFRDTVVDQNPSPASSQEPRERFEVEEYRSDPNMTEQMGINPLTRMQQLQNDQMVSAGRPTPNVLNPEYDPRGQVGNIPEGRRKSVPENFGGVNQQISMEDDLDYLREKRINQGKVNEGYAAGGEAVPNKLKGFSKLPESVQRRMNPQLAQQYAQGGIASMMDPASLPQGNPMMGGMPQGGQMDPAQMAMMEAEAAGQAQGEQIGAMVGEQTMMGLDQAEDFQGAIDALRGNSVPMEGRYEELAGFVGDEDAMQTPQSVLAMVQPTIMMTEEGAVDSGIGQLMEQITGNIAMETPDGQPTAMAEGVGSLMGVGQQPAEKKLLADGGAVQSFKLGGEGIVPMTDYDMSNLKKSYDDRLKFYGENITGSPQARRDALQSDIYFNLADRALAFSGGVDPNTGENMAGAPLLSQVGRSAVGLGGTISEKLASNRAMDQQLKMQALGAAENEEAARKKTISDERGLAYQNQSRLALKNMDQEFAREENQSARDHEKTMMAYKEDLEKALINARGADTRFTNVQQLQLNKNLAKANTELDKAKMAVAHENDMDKLDVVQTHDLFTRGVNFDFDIAKMERGQEFAKDLTNLNFELDKIKQRTQNSFTAGLSYLTRKDNKDLMITKFEMQEELTRDIKAMDISEQEKTRAIQEMKIKNDAIFTQQSLNIDKLKYAWNKEYEGALVQIKQDAANAISLGTKAETASITFLTSNLEAYKNGTISGPDKLKFEFVANIMSKPEFNRLTGTSSRLKLPPEVQAVLDGITDPELDGEPIALRDATSENSDIINADGTVNLESSAWSTSEPNRYDPDIDYKKVIGASRIFPSLRKAASEGYSELTDGTPTQEAKDISKAQKTLDAFANDLLQLNTQFGDGGQRVLKFVQELIEKETSNIRPGGLFLKTDSDARSSLTALRAGLMQEMQLQAERLKEYGGSPEGYTPQQVTGSRAVMGRLKVLLNEVLAFEKGFGFDSRETRTGLDSTEDQSTESARDQILQMRMKNDVLTFPQQE